ncbi:MAG: hypothetical protein KAV87_55265 [Desulfobacteraceae bacterium]|jgi:hypothetical protein|nr:hypothetical protein [Desulfobacteraceae bacterium]
MAKSTSLKLFQEGWAFSVPLEGRRIIVPKNEGVSVKIEEPPKKMKSG